MIDVAHVDDASLEEWVELRNRVYVDDPIDLAAAVRRRERDAHHVDLLARLDGALAGVATYGKLIDHPGSTVGRVGIGVLPELRRRGVATALHRAASEVARGNGDAELEGQVIDPSEAAAAYCAAQGYRAVERMIESRLDLAASAPDRASEPFDVRAVSEDPAVLADAYAIALEAEPDIPQARDWVAPRDFDEWRAREIDDGAFVPEASVVVYVDNRPAAYGLVAVVRDGTADHHATGVARAYRGRRLSYVVKRAQIERARATGLRELVAWNDESNTPMRRVNEKLGYRITRDVVTYRGPLL